MKILYLDVKLTHEGIECPANRYVPHPGGGWVCLDCGRQVILSTIEVIPCLGRREAAPLVLEGDSQ